MIEHGTRSSRTAMLWPKKTCSPGRAFAPSTTRSPPAVASPGPGHVGGGIFLR